ncbi:DNA polymerase III subunit chi [Spiribacter pallidus]|jgi:DNA polymerase-3 subunit chi|uniref:DNA polymerase III subunit chi n=2 Tax=Spiribacter pallidus TaxID=1987936 RepID=A0ABV3TET9_9GAMM
MMPRIDFYILDRGGDDAREHFCCRLAARAWQQGLDVHIRTADEASAQRLDEALWTFEPESFIPHGQSSQDGHNPIVIHPDPAPGRLLINLGEDLPAQWSERERIAEIITADEAVRRAGRQRYRDYQQAGIDPRTHRIEH